MNALTETPFVEVTKEFNAPIEKVWQAWSDGELIKEWWGPKGFTSPSAQTHFEIDGTYLFAMKSPEGQTVWSTGTYQEIIPHELIVCTDQFSDEQGHLLSPEEAGMGEEWQGRDTLVFSVKFDKITSGKTRIQLVHEGIPTSMHDDCVEGWSTSLDKMKKVVENKNK